MGFAPSVLSCSKDGVRRLVLTVCGVLAVAGLASCSDGKEGKKAAAKSSLMVVRDVSPFPDVRLQVGDALHFENDDDVAHTFTADGGLFDSGRVEPGGEFRFQMPAAGELTYHCEIHPSMKGRVVVEAPPS